MILLLLQNFVNTNTAHKVFMILIANAAQIDIQPTKNTSSVKNLGSLFGSVNHTDYNNKVGKSPKSDLFCKRNNSFLVCIKQHIFQKF